MAGERISVFGGSGFVGQHLVRQLAEQGAIIRVGVRHPDPGIFAGFPPGRTEPIRADILDDASVRNAIEGSDAVINLVGILYETGRQTFVAIHEEAARRVAVATRAAGIGSLIHMSALGADLTSPSAYARTKAAGEIAVRDAFPNAVIVRPSIMFGPGDRFFNRFAAMARFSPALPLIGGGRTRFQPVYVEDVARAFATLLAQPQARGRTYELGGPRVYTFREMMTLLLAELERHRLLVPVPFAIAEVQGWLLQHLPNPPLTRDQVELLKRDNVVSGRNPTFADLGIAPAPLESILPTYLGASAAAAAE